MTLCVCCEQDQVSTFLLPFPPLSHFLCIAYIVTHTLDSTYKYPSPALAKARQLWPPLSLHLVLRLILRMFTTLTRLAPTPLTSEPYVYLPSVTADRLSYRAALSRRLIPDNGCATSPCVPFLKHRLILAFLTLSGTWFVLPSQNSRADISSAT